MDKKKLLAELIEEFRKMSDDQVIKFYKDNDINVVGKVENATGYVNLHENADNTFCLNTLETDSINWIPNENIQYSEISTPILESYVSLEIKIKEVGLQQSTYLSVKPNEVKYERPSVRIIMDNLGVGFTEVYKQEKCGQGAFAA